MKPEWIYRLYRRAKVAGDVPLLIAEIEQANPQYLTRYRLEQSLDGQARPTWPYPSKRPFKDGKS